MSDDVEAIPSWPDDGYPPAPTRRMVALGENGHGHVLDSDHISGVTYATQNDGKMTLQIHMVGGQSLNWGPESVEDMDRTVRLLLNGESANPPLPEKAQEEMS